MCLEIKKGQKSEVNHKEFTVYKVYLASKSLGEGELRSYYQGAITQKGEQPKVELGKAKTDQYFNVGMEMIQEGYHSFKNLEDARRFAQHERFGYIFAPKYYRDIVIHECKIPSATEFYKGIFRYGFKDIISYASDQLYVGEEIEAYKFDNATIQ